MTNRCPLITDMAQIMFLCAFIVYFKLSFLFILKSKSLILIGQGYKKNRPFLQINNIIIYSSFYISYVYNKCQYFYNNGSKAIMGEN